MKKIAFALILLPAISFADNVNLFSAEFGKGSDNIDSFNIGYEAVIGGKLSVGLDYVDLQFEDGTEYDTLEVNVDFALGSFDTGSLYAGVGAVMPYNMTTGNKILDGLLQSPSSDHDKLSNAFNAGFAKRSGDGLDYDLGVVVVDNYKLYRASLRAPLGDSGFGLTYAVDKVDNGVALCSLGLSFTL
jgi:hypothetical protein